MINHENDGMRYPSIDQLVSKTHSKYKLVVGAAKRAREIDKDKNQLISNTHSKKSIGIALEEIYEGKVTIINNNDQKE